jgi:hypothetical protein
MAVAISRHVCGGPHQAPAGGNLAVRGPSPNVAGDPASPFLIEKESTMAITIYNSLGTGRPKLTMELAGSGVAWAQGKIEYKGFAEAKWSDDGTKQWSSWNVVDEKGNYYGNINLNCDGTNASLGNYTKPESQYYLTGFRLTRGEEQSAYYLTVEGVFGVLDAPLATPALYPGTNRPILLSTTNDGKIVNDHGNVVVLKGLARPSLEWDVNGQYLSSADIATMRTWGANVIRISLNQAFWLGSAPRESFGSYKQIVDAIIYYAIGQKMAVILDLHILKDVPRGGHAVQDNMANQDSVHFWEDIARTYANFGTVLFELYNEPNVITHEQWRCGGGPPPPPNVAGEGPYVGYQRLYDAVRGAGAKNLCIVAGTGWGYDLSFVSSDFGVRGTGIVYCAHPWWPRGMDSGLAGNLAGVLGKFPVIFTEFGCNDWDSYDEGKGHFYPAFYHHVLDYINANGFHYTGWGWWVESDNPNRVGQPMPGPDRRLDREANQRRRDHPRRPPEAPGHSDRVRQDTGMSRPAFPTTANFPRNTGSRYRNHSSY